MSKWTSKNHKNWHNTPVVLCWHEKFFESNKRQWISFRPQRWDVPYRNHQACCEKLWFVRSISPNLPKMGQKNYNGMLMLLHDSMPSFMNFRRALDLLEFKNQVPQCLWPSDGGRVFDIHSHFLHDLSMQPRTHIWIFNLFICIRACACSWNLNFAHECIENSVNA